MYLGLYIWGKCQNAVCLFRAPTNPLIIHRNGNQIAMKLFQASFEPPRCITIQPLAQWRSRNTYICTHNIYLLFLCQCMVKFLTSLRRWDQLPNICFMVFGGCLGRGANEGSFGFPFIFSSLLCWFTALPYFNFLTNSLRTNAAAATTEFSTKKKDLSFMIYFAS
jgi:hypothetical protein